MSASQPVLSSSRCGLQLAGSCGNPPVFLLREFDCMRESRSRHLIILLSGLFVSGFAPATSGSLRWPEVIQTLTIRGPGLLCAQLSCLALIWLMQRKSRSRLNIRRDHASSPCLTYPALDTATPPWCHFVCQNENESYLWTQQKNGLSNQVGCHCLYEHAAPHSLQILHPSPLLHNLKSSDASIMEHRLFQIRMAQVRTNTRICSKATSTS